MAVVQTQQTQSMENSKPKYGKVILTLENCILPTQKLGPTPSSVDGLDSEAEMDLRILGCELIQTSGILLRLPQVAMATGQVLYQRFYYSKSFVRHSMEIVAMACVTLASKIEEAPRRIRDVINVFHHIKQVRCGKTIQPLILDQSYINLKNQVIKAERRILKELGFCVHVKHPHKIIVMLLQVLECERNKKLMQTAWNYMNDSLRSDVFVRYQPESIACACIYLSARVLRIALPVKPAWHLIFGVSEETIKHICSTILNLYTRKKPDQEKLEKTVEELRKAHQEAKMKAKNLSGSNTPVVANNAGFSPNSRPNSPKADQSPREESKKDKEEGRGSNAENAVKADKENHVMQSKKRHSVSPRSPSPPAKKAKSASSSGRSVSATPSPKHKTKTPPRSYKEPHHRGKSRSHSRSRSRDRKDVGKHHPITSSSSHKRGRRSHSRSPVRSRSRSKSPPVSHRHAKKSHKEKSRSRKSRSRSRERNHHSALGYESRSVSHKSRKERSRDGAAIRSRSRSRDRGRR